MLRRGGAISREQAALGVCHPAARRPRAPPRSAARWRDASSRRARPALLACADFWQPQVARAAAAALAALTEDAGAAVALMRATPADIEKSAGAPSMAAEVAVASARC